MIERRKSDWGALTLRGAAIPLLTTLCGGTLYPKMANEWLAPGVLESWKVLGWVESRDAWHAISDLDVKEQPYYFFFLYFAISSIFFLSTLCMFFQECYCVHFVVYSCYFFLTDRHRLQYGECSVVTYLWPGSPKLLCLTTLVSLWVPLLFNPVA